MTGVCPSHPAEEFGDSRPLSDLDGVPSFLEVPGQKGTAQLSYKRQSSLHKAK